MRIGFVLLLLVSSFSAPAQVAEDKITLVNPSFEDEPGCCSAPDGWVDCGDPLETPPDVQPKFPPIFAVSKAANHGNTYLGLVVRDNDTWESVGQRLERPVVKGKCYSFSLVLCRSATYLSPSKKDINVKEGFTQPVVIRVWGGNDYCQKKELLGETRPVDNTDWKRYTFRMEPKSSLQYICIEAFYKTPTLFPYNGNILVDNASPITVIPCSPEEEPIAAVGKPKPKQEKPAVKPTVVAENKPAPSKTRILKDLDPKKIKPGQVITLDKLFFEMDSSSISLQSRPVLDEVYDFLSENLGVTVEIGGHTNSVPSDAYCDKLSTARARAVVDYLTQKGIEVNRLRYKGYGKRRPIASNGTVDGRRKNQRVEIKILEIDT